MEIKFDEIFSPYELKTLASIVQVGDATYHELMDAQHLFGHSYFADTKGRIRTKLVQVQCEIESHDPKFPFQFIQREFQYGQLIPELRTKNIILHIARSSSPQALSYASKYKIELSNNNHSLQRQMIIDADQNPPYGEEPYYGILTFGGRGQTFSVIQFPEPGYTGVADYIMIPEIVLVDETEILKITHSQHAFKMEKFLKGKRLH